MKDQKGFSIIELLIVVLIIAILAAIAIPNLIGARRSANEASAISNMRVLHSAEAVYSRTTGGGAFTQDFDDLVNTKVIDGVLGSGSKSGFVYLIRVNPIDPKTSFTVGAIPSVTSGMLQTGSRRFCNAADGVIRFENDPSLIGINIVNDGDCNESNYSGTVQ